MAFDYVRAYSESSSYADKKRVLSAAIQQENKARETYAQTPDNLQHSPYHLLLPVFDHVSLFRFKLWPGVWPAHSKPQHA